LFALLTGSASVYGREPLPNEGEIATELFGLIAEQSGCKAYAVAWLDRTQQQVEARCAATLAQAQQIPAGVAWQTRFVVGVSTARTERKRHFGATLPKSATVLAHLLTVNRERRGPRDFGAPLLLYRQAAPATSDVEVADTRSLSRGKDGAIFVFSE
jgi:hypothetical protein